MSDFKQLIAKIADGDSLSESDAGRAFDLMMSGEAGMAQIGGFLMALRVRGESITEITAGARALRSRVLAVETPADAIDTCGTGGDGAGTYNISTAAALVTAACGVPVAKHGNRALSSRSGSAEVLTALGVTLEAPPERIARCIREAGIGFFFAPQHHAAMKHVAPARLELGTRTIFNLLGPLSNPGGVTRQLVGVFAGRWVRPLAEVLHNLGTRRAWVVHGCDGLDELSTTGPSDVAELRDGAVREFQVTPADAGLAETSPDSLKGGDPAENAAALTALLEGSAGAYRDIVLLNTAAALMVADKVQTLSDGAAMAANAIDDGAARRVLARLVEISGETS